MVFPCLSLGTCNGGISFQDRIDTIRQGRDHHLNPKRSNRLYQDIHPQDTKQTQDSQVHRITEEPMQAVKLIIICSFAMSAIIPYLLKRERQETGQ